MKIKILSLYAVFYSILFIGISPHTVYAGPSNNCTIRATQDSDFPAIEALGVKTFTHVKKLTSQEDIQTFKNVYKEMVQEDKKHLAGDKTMVSAVAVSQGAIVGFLSANATNNLHESYVRTLMVDPIYQGQGIGKALVRWWLFKAEIQRAVCLTNKKNENAQKLYEALGGKRVENPVWSFYLYRILNKDNFVGYEFNQAAMAAIKKRLS